MLVVLDPGFFREDGSARDPAVHRARNNACWRASTTQSCCAAHPGRGDDRGCLARYASTA